MNEISTKIIFKQKNDPLFIGNYCEIQNENDLNLALIFDFNDQKLLTNFYNKLPALKDLITQIKNLLPQLNVVYDFDPLTKKLFLILTYAEYFLENNVVLLHNALTNLKKLKIIEINDRFASVEHLRKGLQNNISIKKINFNLFDESLLQKVLESVRLNKSIETLCLKDLKLKGDGIKEIFTSFLTDNASLQSLNISRNKIDENGNGLESLKDLLLLSKVPLKKINLTNNGLKEENFSQNLGEIIKSKDLTKLKLNKCRLNTFDSFNKLYNYVNPSSLQILDLSFNYIDLDLISDFIVNNNNLTKLILQRIKIPKASDITRFGNCFMGSTSLKMLGFYYDIIEDNAIIQDPGRLVEFFNGFSIPPGCEKSYKLYKTELNPDILSVFSNVITANDCLTEIDMSYCTFKNQSFRIFLNSFLKSTNLKSILLDSIELETGDFKFFSDFLPQNKSLKKIDLSNVKIITEDLGFLGDGIIGNPQLKIIILSNCLSEDTNTSVFFDKISNSTLEEIDFTFCDCNLGYSVPFGNFLNKCLTLKIVKLGKKQEDYDSKTNNSIFAITNKLNIEQFSISNIKFDGIAMKDFISNCDNLKKLTMNNSVKNTNFVKFLVEKNIVLDSIEFGVSSIDTADVEFLKKLLSNVKSFILKSQKVEPEQSEVIFEGLIGNKVIEYFDVKYDFDDFKFKKTIQDYYKNILTCENLTNLILCYLKDDDEFKIKGDLKETTKNLLNDFSKSLST